MQVRRTNDSRVGSRAGFTLLEVLVTLALISIIGAISLYAYHQMRPRMQLNNTAREVVGFIYRARLTAIRMSRIVTVSVETKLGGESEPFNPTGIRSEWLVLSVVDAFGNTEEISSYQIPKSYPRIFLWGEDETSVHGNSSNTFSDDVAKFNPDGTVSGTGAFRFSYPKDGARNILEVAIVTQSGTPVIRKYLKDSDRPSSAAAQEFFAETTATSTRANIWIWY